MKEAKFHDNLKKLATCLNDKDLRKLSDKKCEEKVIKLAKRLFGDINFTYYNLNLIYWLIKEHYLYENSSFYDVDYIRNNINLSKIIGYLAKNGVDINVKSGVGDTILHQTCWYRFDSTSFQHLFDVALENNFDINATDDSFNTILHRLLGDIDKQAIDFLLANIDTFVEHGFDFYTMDERGLNSFDLICQKFSSFNSNYNKFNSTDYYEPTRFIINKLFSLNLKQLVDGLCDDDQKNKELLTSFSQIEYATSYIRLIFSNYDFDTAIPMIEKLLRIGVSTKDSIFKDNDIILELVDNLSFDEFYKLTELTFKYENDKRNCDGYKFLFYAATNFSQEETMKIYNLVLSYGDSSIITLTSDLILNNKYNESIEVDKKLYENTLINGMCNLINNIFKEKLLFFETDKKKLQDLLAVIYDEELVLLLVQNDDINIYGDVNIYSLMNIVANKIYENRHNSIALNNNPVTVIEIFKALEQIIQLNVNKTINKLLVKNNIK